MKEKHARRILPCFGQAGRCPSWSLRGGGESERSVWGCPVLFLPWTWWEVNWGVGDSGGDRPPELCEVCRRQDRGPRRRVLVWPWASGASCLALLLPHSQSYLGDPVYRLRLLGPVKFVRLDLGRKP